MNRIARPLTLLVLFTALDGCGGTPEEPRSEAADDAVPTVTLEAKAEGTQPGLSIEIRQSPEDGQAWDRSPGVRVRLDAERLRAQGLSREDVMTALTPSSMLGTEQPRSPPIPGVMFQTRPLRPDQYEAIVLKANAEGEILRLKEIARVEWLSAGP